MATIVKNRILVNIINDGQLSCFLDFIILIKLMAINLEVPNP